MIAEKVKVKIVRSKSDVLWYRNKIGKEFTVIDSGSKKGDTYYLKDKGNRGFIIFKEDVELID